MIPFARQLRFLLWKGVVVKKRQKAWLAVEILVPILLFAILALIRTRDFSEHHPTCHYASKGFVSAGLMPFLNGWLCYVTNQCSETPITGDEQRILGDGMQTSLLVQGVRAFSDQLEIIGKDPQGFNKSMELIARAIHSLASKNLTQLQPDITSELLFKDVHKNLTQLHPNITSELLFKDFFNPSVNVSNELKKLGMNDKMATAVANARVTPAFYVNLAKEARRYSNSDPISIFGFGFTALLDTVELFCIPEKFNASFVLPPSTPELTKEDTVSLCQVYVAEIATGPLADGLDAQAICNKIFPGLEMDIKALQGLGKQIGKSKERTENKGKKKEKRERRNQKGYCDNTCLRILFAVVDFVDGPLGQFLKQFSNLNSTADVISALTCGQDIAFTTKEMKQNMESSGVNKPSTMSASMKGNKAVVHTVLDTLRDFILDYVQKATPGRSGARTDTDCYGIPIVENSNCSFAQHVMLQQVLPMLQGRILVAPAGPLVDQLIAKLNDPLRYADFFATLFPQYAEISTALQDAINLSDLPKAATNAIAEIRRVGILPNETLDKADAWVRFIFAPTSDPDGFGAKMNDLATNLTSAVNCVMMDRIVPIANETAMEAAAMCLQGKQQYFSGIVLSGITHNDTGLPSVVTYKIRHQAAMVDGTTSAADSAGNTRARDTPFVDLKYTTFGFSYLQEAVEKALREMLTADASKDLEIGAYSQMEPYPCYTNDTFNVTTFLAMFVILSWMIPSALLVKNIVYEKEQRLKELMRIMGLGDTIHFLSWALISLVLNTLSVIVISVLLKYGDIIPSTDLSLLLIFLFLFALASVAQSLLLSTFFSNANIATACTAVVFFLCFYPFQLSIQTRNPIVTKISLMFPQTAMGFGLSMIAMGDDNGNSNWKTIGQLRLDTFQLSLTEVMVALAIDTVLFCILAWYISAVHPGVHGVSQPWYFFCQPSYWMPKDEGVDTDNFTGVVHETSEISSNNLKMLKTPQSDRVERDPVDAKMTVSIRGLEKIYDNGMKALDGLNLRLYEGQITGLLGHNGAGKTTTMSMLCGLFSPSGGTASVYGRDLRKEMRAVRDTLGVCPQHNVLFDVLTVREQLYFYAALKGVANENLENEVLEVIESTGLEEKADCTSGSLSGGQKRRLCIGIALIGGSRFVILDEPTAGVDVNSRKSIWKLLMKHKKERTILLSTHHMDEADMLSDRIAILSEGKLSALGSSVFLKNRFGRYTTLTCIKKDRKRDYKPEIEQICTLYEKLPVTLADETDEELTFHLPINSNSCVLEEFFRLFDERLSLLHLAEYGISAPTLQDIFVSLAPQADLKLTKVEDTGCIDSILSCIKRGKSSAVAASDESELVRDPALTEGGGDTPDVCDTATPLKQDPKKSRHARALLTARANYTRRSKITLFFEMIAPILLLLLCELYAKYINKMDQRVGKMKTQPPMFLMPALYGNNSMHYLSLWNQNATATGAELAESLLEFPGMGTRCVPDGPQWKRDEDPVCSFLLKDGQHRLDDACLMPLSPKDTLQGELGKTSNTYRLMSKDKALPPICCSNDTSYPCLKDADLEDKGTLTFSSLLNDRQIETEYSVNQTCGENDEGYWTCTQLDYPMDELVYKHERTSDFLFDLSYRNLSQFRLITQFSVPIGEGVNKSYTFTGGLSLGHENPLAPSGESVTQRKSGWRTLRDVMTSQAGVIGLDLSSLPTPYTQVSSFAANITLNSFMDRLIATMDTKDSVKLWYNNKRWASLPIYTNILSNALLRLLHIKKKEPLADFKQGIVGVNHPMNSTLEDSFDQSAIQKVTMFRVVLLVLVLSVIPAGYAVFLVEERVCHSFHLQLVSGLSRKMYWAMSFLFDMSLYLLSIMIIIGIYLLLGVKDFTYTPGLAGAFILLWMLYGLVDVILVYILQRNFNIAALAFVMISIGTFFVGIVTTMTVVILEQLMKTDATLVLTHDICAVVFQIVPQYNLGMAISRGAMAYQSVAMGESYLRQINRPDLVGTIPMPNVMMWELMGRHVVALLIQLFVGAFLLVFLEHGSLGFLRRLERKKTEEMMDGKEKTIHEDVDVSVESERVRSIETSNEEYGLVVKGLAKAFSDKLTVCGVSFAVERGECFGLLGLNGAGKTTTFGMMTGKLDIGHGEVRILGERVSSRSSDGFRNLGYCPQFDALNMKLTTKENVEFFARIRGIDERSMKGIVDTLLRSLHLLPYADILTAALSGGNRRKLSVAVALVSQPPVIMLDEPSAGMDPGSQQFLWSVIGKMRRAGRAVVLTSHSMEECEALCTRIAILDKGKIRCIGSKQHLKSKFGEGFSLTIKFTTTQQAEESEQFICERLPKAKLVAVHCSAAFYRIPSDLTTVVQILQIVNKVKERFNVEDFSLSQTTLDEIFQYLSETSSTTQSAECSA